MKITDASHLSNVALVSEVGRLAGREREATVAFIVHLAEFDARRLYAEAGRSSTYAYCLEVLRLSEDAAWNRIDAGRAARAHPAVLDLLVSGALSPTTARMLRPHLTAENAQDLLAAAGGKSKRQVELLLAERFPRPDVPDSVRTLTAQRISPVRPTGIDLIPTAVVSAVPSIEPRAISTPTPVASARPPVVRPLSTERYEVRFTASAPTHEALRRAQDLLAGGGSSRDLDHVFGRALILLVADLERAKAATTSRPRPARNDAGANGNSRYLPAAVRREVWARDGGRCTFVAAGGRRCEARRYLEYHHGPVPYGVGGKATRENIHLLCRAHNRYESERFYGPGREYGGIDPAEVTRSGTGASRGKGASGQPSP
jgi:hypothetical protein